MSLVCEECSHSFQVPPSRASQRWCSWECRIARPRQFRTRKPPVEKSCVECSAKFEAKYKKRHAKFCSLPCASAFNGRRKRKAKVKLECKNCGAVVMAFPSVADRKKYCSRRCAALARPIVGSSKIADDAISLWSNDWEGPPYETEYRIDRWSIDLAFPPQKVAIELDGSYWHSLPDMVEKDQTKDAALVDQGWVVYRIEIPAGMDAAELAQAITTTTEGLLCAMH